MKRLTATLILAAACALFPHGGKADPIDPPVSGPKRICFDYSTFDLAEGERITDFSGSMHSKSITVRGPRGSFYVTESDIFARPKDVRLPVFQKDGTSVRQPVGESGYGIWGVPSFSDKEQLMIRLAGPALDGTAADARIYGRLNVVDPRSLRCDQKFTSALIF